MAEPTAATGADAPPPPDIVRVLVENHRQFLAFLEKRVGSRAESEDILQDAFVRSIDKASSIRDGEAATAWFYRLLRNAIIDHARRRAVETRALERAATEPSLAPAEDRELFDTVCQCVSSLVDTLKPEYAEALTHVDVRGTAVREWAESAGISPNNAAVRLHRARQALKRQVERTCGTCATHGCFECHCDERPGATAHCS
ncbi:MAG: sigma-70 family RNA polymerase sigma factor [Deltaproteobacteria bacterium]|nr:sigma-70 family RNA polymerase sigma factor [Deltaproteobacteria bacterium]